MSEEKSTGSELQLPEEIDTELVQRSVVTPGLEYPKYKPDLRRDFFGSCAYCTMTESEAQAIRMTIDHYEPQKHRADLINEYSNLFYCCDECNNRKGPRFPTPEMRADGNRFFRADTDLRSEHFEVSGVRVNGITNVGKFTTDAVDLNRMMLRRLRAIREDLTSSVEFIAGGVLALRSFPIDQLPPRIKVQALAMRKRVEESASDLIETVDKLLASYATSPLLEDERTDDDKRNDAERLKRLRGLDGMNAGNWGRRRRKKKSG